MKSRFTRLERWHRTRAGLLTFGLVELGLAYGAASWAIDRGSPLVYLLTLVLLIGVLQNAARFLRTFIHGPNRRQTTKA